MKQFKPHLVVLTTIVTVLILWSHGCSTDKMLNPEEKAQMDTLDTQLNDWKSKQKAYEQEAAQELKSLSTAVTPADQQAVMTSVQATQTKWQETLTQQAAIMKQEDDLTAKAQNRVVGGYVQTGQTVTSGINPGLGLIYGMLAPLAVGLFSKRTRGHLADSLLSLVKLNGMDFLSYIGKSYGWINSEPGDFGHVDAAPIVPKLNLTGLPPAVMNPAQPMSATPV